MGTAHAAAPPPSRTQAMDSGSSPLVRRIGMALFLGAVAFVVVGMLIREPWPNDFYFLFVRWPVWLTLAVATPLVVLRVVLWHRRRRRRRAERESSTAA